MCYLIGIGGQHSNGTVRRSIDDPDLVSVCFSVAGRTVVADRDRGADMECGLSGCGRCVRPHGVDARWFSPMRQRRLVPVGDGRRIARHLPSWVAALIAATLAAPLNGVRSCGCHDGDGVRPRM